MSGTTPPLLAHLHGVHRDNFTFYSKHRYNYNILLEILRRTGYP